MAFTANITVTVDHVDGPTISNPQHLAAWLVADNADYSADRDDLMVAVCPGCPDPDDCQPGCPAPSSLFLVKIDTVNSIDPV